MVSLPTYDPNPLSRPNKGEVNKPPTTSWPSDKGQPLLNRAIDRTYPPGSTFKVVTLAAYLESDDTVGPQTQVDAPQRSRCPTPPQAAQLRRRGVRRRAGDAVYALEKSCNTPFGKIGMDLGYDKMQRAGGEVRHRREPLADPDAGGAGSSSARREDQAALAQASIGQRSNQMTPLQMAMVAAGIANNGVVMKPYLVNKIADSEGGEVQSAEPEELSTAISEDSARKLHGDDGQRRRQGHRERRADPGGDRRRQDRHRRDRPGQAPHAWFISFAPAEDPKIALALIVESGSAGGDATGGHTAAPIAKSVMEAVLGK